VLKLRIVICHRKEHNLIKKADKNPKLMIGYLLIVIKSDL